MADTVHLRLQPPPTHHRRISRPRRLPVQCADARQAMFSRIAPVYDNLNDVLSLGQHRIWKRDGKNFIENRESQEQAQPLGPQEAFGHGPRFVGPSRAKEGSNVLDLCCGSGDLAFLLSEKVGPNGKVIGLDFSKEQLSVASSRQHSCSKACYYNIEWVEGNALELPFPDSYFDAVTMGYGLRNVINFHRAMEEMYRVLKPSSKVSILDFNKSTNTFSASIQEWMIDNVVVPAANSYGLAVEYKYLKSSIQEFLTGKESEKLALEVGFENPKHYEIGGGLTGNLVATR